MPDVGWLFWTLFLVLLPIVWWRERPRLAEQRRDALRKHGRRLRGQLDLVYGDAHEFVELDALPPHLERTHYDRMQAALEAEGFRTLADVEDVTMTRAYPELRTCIRVLVGHAGHTLAGIAQLRVRGWKRWFARLARVPVDAHALEFTTELEDGHFVVTNNLEGHASLPVPPAWLVRRHAPDTPLAALLRAHREHVAHAGGVAVRRTTKEDALASARRMWRAAADHWTERGGLTKEDWDQLAGKPTRTKDELFEEVVR